MRTEEPQTKPDGGASASLVGLGLIARLDDMVRDMTENRVPRVVDWPGTIRQAADELRKVQEAPRAT